MAKHTFSSPPARTVALTAVFVLLMTGSATTLEAQAVRTNAGFTASMVPQGLVSMVNDVPLPFSALFFGSSGGSIGINQHGYITFGVMTDAAGAQGLFMSPLNANIDTRLPGGSAVTYGADMVDGRAAFGINWLNMIEWDPSSTTQGTATSSFQLVLIERSDMAAGDFDFEFNYDSMGWPDLGYLGGFGEGCLYAPGDPVCPPGTPVQIAITPDGQPGATIEGSLNSSVAGRYRYGVRGGAVILTGLDPDAPAVVPEPATLSLMLLGLGALGAVAVRTRRRK